MIPNLGEAGQSVRLDDGSGSADQPVSVQVLLKAGLERFQRIVSPRHNGDIREVIAAAVGDPNYILIGPPILPGNFTPAGRASRADGRPAPKPARHKIRAGVLQRGT